MRIDSGPFIEINQSTTKKPRFVVKVDWATPYYFTSHKNTALPDGVANTQNVITSLAVTSQSLDPLKARTTIGSVSFSVLNKDNFLSLLLKGKDENGEGVRQKTVEIYVGDEDLAWSDYQLIQTQIMGPYSNVDQVYKFTCEDIQRSTIKNIFDSPSTNITTSNINAPLSTSLDATLNAGANSVTVDDTSGFNEPGKFILNQEIISYTNTTPTTFTGLTRGELFTVDITHSINDVITEITETINCVTESLFELIEHGTSYSDAPNATVGYIKIDDEIIRYYSTSTGEFNDCVRGVLNTKAVVHEFDPTSQSDRNPKIEAYLYYEMPALKFALAVQTGDLYNQSGKTIESYSHLNISSTFVATSKFIAHPDLYDVNDDTLGFNVRFEGVSKQDGQQFLQKEIYLLVGGFSPVLSDGQLSFERSTGVLSDSHYVAVLDDTNITRYGSLNADTSRVLNEFTILWNWNEKAQSTTRENTLVDNPSKIKHQDAPAITKTFRGLYGGIHSTNILNSQFDALRDRYAGPPWLITVTCLHRMNFLEVGDIVRLKLNNVSDHTNENLTTTDLDRSFEIQKVTIDWVTGSCTFQLFGSSDKATPIATSAGASFLDASYYTSGGVDISTVLPSTFTGGVLHIDGNGTLVGHATDNRLAIYYYDGPVQFDFGTVTTVTEGNIFFRFRGNLQVNGKINLKGIGHAGAGNNVTLAGDFNLGTPGYIGTTLSGGRIWIVPDYISYPGANTVGVNTKIPPLVLTNNGATLDGIPIDLRGTSGASGGTATNSLYLQNPSLLSFGGVGGVSGGGAVFVSQGVDFGVNGEVDVSGDDGGLGVLHSSAFVDANGGSGAGGSPGAVYFLIDGATSTVGSLNVTANQGLTPINGVKLNGPSVFFDFPFNYPEPVYTFYVSNGNEATTKSISSHIPLYIPANLNRQVDQPTETSKPIKITLAEVTNTPESISGNFSSIEVTVTPPLDANYNSTNLYAKLSTNSEYLLLGSANQETSQLATMDGSIYDFRAFGVSDAGIETDDFVQKSIQVSNTSGGVNFAEGNYIASGKTSFADNTPGFYLEKTAIGGRAVFGGSGSEVEITDTGDVNITGKITAGSGFIGAWKITANTIENTNGRIKLDHGNNRIRVQNAGGTNHVTIDENGLIGFDNILGTTFTIPTNGNAPTFASGVINTTVFNVSTSGVIRTSTTVGDGSANSNGVIINNTGLKVFQANSSTPSLHASAVDGTTIMGIVADDQYARYDGVNFEIGRDSELLGAEAYNNENIYIHEEFEVINIANVQNIGAGSVVSLSSGTMFLMPDLASGNRARYVRTKLRGFVTPSWSKKREFRSIIQITDSSATGLFFTYFGMGDLVYFVRFKSNGLSLVGECGNGAGTSGTALMTITSGIDYEFEARWVPGVHAEFFVDGVSKGIVSGNLPTAGFGATTLLNLWVQNTAIVTTAATLEASETKVLQEKT